MRKYLIWASSLFLFLGTAAVLVVARNGHLPIGKFSNRSQAAAESRRALINQELNTLKGHPWAGRYYYGDGLGVNVNLSLAPKSGFEFTWYGCLGLYDLNYGGVVEKDGKLGLIFTHSNDRKGFQGIAPELVPLVWGERHYLIPSDGFIDFSNAVNAGFETSHSVSRRFLVRERDELKEVKGLPNLPLRYSEYLLERPIKADISSIKGSRIEDSTRITTILLNVGGSQRVKEGLEFHLYSPSTLYVSARVTKVGTSSSEAEISQDKGIEDCGRPSIGWKLSTSARRH
jgi:hypothetical protein